ncbi:hypothetical protein [Dyella choica]|uniref:Uncharacterized protein n=1 Tax=Dyella choica TaxID=1927959 RepID=A0A432M9X9_9GAMM|nr:hypothetical protein [Dyella choica]RUL78957.1 hypothetical protein EKH80_03925 [Dyella choica]
MHQWSQAHSDTAELPWQGNAYFLIGDPFPLADSSVNDATDLSTLMLYQPDHEDLVNEGKKTMRQL